jgi:hypothetical protein
LQVLLQVGDNTGMKWLDELEKCMQGKAQGQQTCCARGLTQSAGAAEYQSRRVKQ